MPRFLRLTSSQRSAMLFGAVLLLNPLITFHERAFAVQARPPTTVSRYMNTADPRVWEEVGKAMGQADLNRAGIQDNIVILALGRPRSRVVNGITEYGVTLFKRGRSDFTPLSSIAQAAKAMGRAYWQWTGVDYESTLVIAIGTSNDYNRTSGAPNEVTANHGRALAETVNAINDYFGLEGYMAQASAAGATDIELVWNVPAATKAWAQGYNNYASWPYYNFGTCEGCAPRCCMPNGWTQFDVWYVSWGLLKAQAVPEIYNTSGINATQWQRISLYGYLNQSGRAIGFAGPLTQQAACAQRSGGCPGTDNSPADGWTQLWEAINADSRTARNLRWSTDISHRDKG